MKRCCAEAISFFFLFKKTSCALTSSSIEGLRLISRLEVPAATEFVAKGPPLITRKISQIAFLCAVSLHTAFLAEQKKVSYISHCCFLGSPLWVRHFLHDPTSLLLLLVHIATFQRRRRFCRIGEGGEGKIVNCPSARQPSQLEAKKHNNLDTFFPPPPFPRPKSKPKSKWGGYRLRRYIRARRPRFLPFTRGEA